MNAVLWEDLFSIGDLNADGLLDRAELSQLLQLSGMQHSDQACNTIVLVWGSMCSMMVLCV